MNAHGDWLDFAPPKARGLGRPFALAVVAHLVLVAALTMGVQWTRDAPAISVEAELWSAVPAAAAPKLIEAPPPPPPPPAPPAVPAPAPPAAAVQAPDADIAVQKARKQQELDTRLEAQQLERQKAAQDKLAQEKLAQEKRLQEKRIALEKKREQDLKIAQDKKKREDEAKRLEEEEKKRELAQKARQDAAKSQQQAALEKEQAIKLESQRKDNLQRMAGLAGASGGANASGKAQRASGPSAGYGSRVSAIVKPNIVFIEDPQDNPQALVEVRTAPDGTIVKRSLIKSSGNKAWDDAVLRAIDKTAVLPRDVDGTVPPLLEINFRRRD